MKTCGICGTNKPPSDFHKNSRSKDGMAYCCKVCASNRKKDWYNNRGGKEITSEWGKEYRANNKDKITARVREWHDQDRKKDPSKYTSRARMRNQNLVGRRPVWANKAAITAIYDDAREFRDAGLDVHVDHVVPLKGMRDGVQVVSGLHVPANLTIKLATWNVLKGSRFDG